MINNIELKDKERFNELGLIVNKNFAKLFQIEELINSSYDSLFGYYENELLVGFIHINKMYETIDIVNIVVDEKYRHQGIATRLIKYVLNNFDDVEKLMLEVNENNKVAINLYLKNGFTEINRRKNYYGKDTAIVMKRDV